MKNKKIINLIVPITTAAVATSAIPLTCFALTSNALSKKKDDSSKKEPKFVQLKNSANPKDVDINDTLQPLTFTSNSPKMMWLEISHTDASEVQDFIIQYRIGSVSMPEGEGKWIYPWTPINDINPQLPIGNDIIIQLRCGYKDGSQDVGKLPNNFNLNFNFINAQGTENLYEVNVGGSASSLLCKYTEDEEGNQTFYGSTEIIQDYCFEGLFATQTGIFSQYNSRLNVMSNFLPFKKLTAGCYNSMFMGSNLVTAPILPSKELSRECYFGMFANCENLTAAPNLPATNILHAENCYSNMFYGCKNLKTISIEYVGNFVERVFKDWVTGVSSAGKIYYSGLDRNKSNSELPANFDVVPDANIIAQCNDIEIKESTSAELTMNPAKTKVRAYKDSKEAGIKYIDIQVSGYKSKVGEGAEFYFADKDEKKIDQFDQLTIGNYPSVVKPVYHLEEKKYDGLTYFTVKQNGSLKITNLASGGRGKSGDAVYYKKNETDNWQELNKGESLDFYVGETILLKSKEDFIRKAGNGFTNICIESGQVELKGTIKSLIGNNNKLTSYAAYELFAGSTGIVSVDKDYLKGYTKYPEACLYRMFYGCTKLKNSITLTGNVFGRWACAGMYSYCKELKEVAPMEIKQVWDNSFLQIFCGCSSIEDASAISINVTDKDNASYLSNSFREAFFQCINLTTPCTVVADVLSDKVQPFYGMFNGCKNLFVTDIKDKNRIKPFFKYAYSWTSPNPAQLAFYNTHEDSSYRYHAYPNIQYYYRVPTK